MTNEEIFSAWLPGDSPWSTWGKPVLFAHLDVPSSWQPVPGHFLDTTAYPSALEKVALVLDLPGVEGVRAGLALAAHGYRPVPLYNALPAPTGTIPVDLVTGRRVAAVDVLPIIGALCYGAEQLALCRLPPEAPPVFLLDANRQGFGQKILPEEFDNRSICFTTDFPSANFLLASGIHRVVIVQGHARIPLDDLMHVLRRWQDGGISLERLDFDSAARPEPFKASRPSWYGAMFQRALAAIGLRRAAGGGFGAWMPDSSAGG